MTSFTPRLARLAISAVLGLSSSVFSFTAHAQIFPNKAINYIIPFPAGGESDVAARLQSKYLQKHYKQDFIVQNRAGGGGAVVWQGLNNLPADGYTIAGTNLPHIILQPLEGTVSYKTEDIVNVFIFHYTPDAIIVPADSPYKTLADLIKAAQANPDKLNIGGSALYSANHLAFSRLNQIGKIKTTYVPFRGTADLTTALLGKHLDAAMSYTTFAASQKGKVRVLAIATPKRSPLFPDTPTFKELGYDWLDGAYRGVAVPKATSEEARKNLSAIFLKINQDPEFRKQMLDGGFEPIDITYEQMPAFMRSRTIESLPMARRMGLIKIQ